MRYSLPQKNRGVVLSHSIKELCLLAESNYEKLNKISLTPEFSLATRFKLRAKVFQISQAHFQRLGITLRDHESKVSVQPLRHKLDPRCSMLDSRCSMLDAGKGSSIQHRASSIQHRGSSIQPPASWDERLQSKIVIATGHQPIFYHPGILFKDMVVNALIERGGFWGLNLVVDSDTWPGQLIPIPCLRDGILSLERVELFSREKNVAAEELPSPGLEEFEANWNYISQKIERLLPGSNRRTFVRYSEITRGLIPFCKNLPELVVFSRRLFEEEMGFKHAEVFLSSLCGGEEFLYFVSLILVRAKEFVLKYNSRLEQYRTKKGIRHPLSPFPNLKIEDSRLELPFWIWEPGQERATLYLKFTGPQAWICRNEEEILDLKAAHLSSQNIPELSDWLGRLEAAGYKLRPKALMLTLFARLFLCDLWIHGVGGAEYEELNNQLAGDLFSVSLPPYAVASATLYLGIKGEEQGPVVDERQIEALRNQLRLMQFNPERFIDSADEESQRLIAERTSLIERMRSVNGPKGELHQKVLAINDSLRDKIAPFRQAVESQLREKEMAWAQESMAANREFPFFLYSQDDLTALYSSVV
ncbi:MAG: hypothetical protein AB1797_05290 [bacterium]